MDGQPVDMKLVLLAKHLEGKIVTGDYNLNKVARLHNVRGHQPQRHRQLAQARLPARRSRCSVRIVKPGEEIGQGVGYLDDGTMIVVEGGRDHIGKEVKINVTSVLQTSAGRMIFGKYNVPRIERCLPLCPAAGSYSSLLTFPTMPPRRIAVIGGGITGLAAAHRLQELAPQTEVALFEASDRLGGVIATACRDGFLVERSADMFTTREPWAARPLPAAGDRRSAYPNEHRVPPGVCRPSRPAGGSAGRVHADEPRADRRDLQHAAPLVARKAAATARDLHRPQATPRRREPAKLRRAAIRQEAFERLIQPLIGGIYTADPARLSLAATLPQFLEMEQKHGSVILATRKQQRLAEVEGASSGARYGMFVAPRDGHANAGRRSGGETAGRSSAIEHAGGAVTPQMDGSWIVQTNGPTAGTIRRRDPGNESARRRAIADDDRHGAGGADLAHFPYASAAW